MRITLLPQPDPRNIVLRRHIGSFLMSTKSSGFHAPVLPSNRRFGCVFAAMFALVAGYLAWRGPEWQAWSALTVAAFFAVATILAPQVLAPLNRLWFAFGILLGRFVNPIVLGAIFFLLITPVALLGRAFGRDPLLMRKRSVASYWTSRDPPGPPPESFRNQY